MVTSVAAPDELALLETLAGLLKSDAIGQFRQWGRKVKDDGDDAPPEEPPQNEKDKKEADFWAEANKVGYEFGANGRKGNPAAGRWQRAHDGSEKLQADYAAAGEGCKGKALWDKQKAFRAKWLKDEHDIYTASKTKSTVVRKTWKKKGAYLPLARIAWKEGGGKSGWLSAVRLFTKCIAMGPPFVKFDGWTESLRALYVVEEYNEEFEEEWRMCEEWIQKSINEDWFAPETSAAAAGQPAASSGVLAPAEVVEKPAADDKPKKPPAAAADAPPAAGDKKKKRTSGEPAPDPKKKKATPGEPAVPDPAKKKADEALLALAKGAKVVLVKYGMVFCQSHAIMSNRKGLRHFIPALQR